jgi:transcription-repair coupling factor (superfamily II helicase)
VRQKERLKQLRAEVDVLTLSATPIPRTLHASLLGIRGISTLDNPPPGRQDVETRVLFRDDHVLQDAVLRELSRGGQVFVLHNRIDELEPLANRLRSSLPARASRSATARCRRPRSRRPCARSCVASSTCWSARPSSRTASTSRAPIRSSSTRPTTSASPSCTSCAGASAAATPRPTACCSIATRHPGLEARARLKALEEFSHLGAGFAIAMKDLEIRGAGNLLGPQQSGHIAAVGYDMYCQLLRSAVDSAKEQRPVHAHIVEVDVDLRLQAFLPMDFLTDPRQRLELLREMDEAIDDEHLAALEAELRDRYGKLPQPVRNLLRVFRLKHGLMGLGVLGVQWVEQDRIVVRHPPGVPLGGSWLDCFADVRPVEAGKTHLMLPPMGRGRIYQATDVLDLVLGAITGKVAARSQPQRKLPSVAPPAKGPKRPPWMR